MNKNFGAHEQRIISVQDLGRLAAFMDDHPGPPMKAVQDWLAQFAKDPVEREKHFNAIAEGYSLEKLFPYSALEPLNP